MAETSYFSVGSSCTVSSYRATGFTVFSRIAVSESHDANSQVVWEVAMIRGRMDSWRGS